MNVKVSRAEIMRSIKKTNTQPELIVRRFLFKHGYRYRLHSKALVGKPDIVLLKFRVVIFVNGCFWHGHKQCRLNKPPRSNVHYWLPKISRNADRDILNRLELQRLGWHVLTVWECDLMPGPRNATLGELVKELVSIGQLGPNYGLEKASKF